MNWNSLLLKPITALVVLLSAMTPWAAGISEEQEESSSFFCIKQAVDIDYNTVIQVSQQNESYEPASNESCFEKWYSPEGDRAAYTFIGELLYNSDNPPVAIELTSDIDFGGYNDQTNSCAEDFWPFDFDVSDQVTLRSVQDNIYTIKGICYITLSGEASFGGNLISSVANVRFENIRLESLTFASFFGTAVEEPDVNNVYVENALISAPVAGLFVSSAYGLYVTDFEGRSISVHSIPDMDLSEAVDLFFPSTVTIGGLAGSVSNMFAVGVSVDGLNVSNNAYMWDGAHRFVEETAQVEAHVGGIVGHTEQVELVRVGLDNSLLSDDASGEKSQMSYLGGLVGSFTYDALVWFHSTYTFSDVTCSVNKDPEFCKAGYLAGLAEFPNSLYKGANDMSLVSNFHYTYASYDSASGLFGEVYCDYLREFMPENEQGQEHISCATEFNTYGELSVLDDGDAETSLVSKTYAYGNFRSATENTFATQDFDPETYTMGGNARAAVSVGVIEKEYMQGQAFADALNQFNSEYGNSSVTWITDNTHEYPYIASTYRASTAEKYTVQVTFMLDCVETQNCLTARELEVLENFRNPDDEGYMFSFVVDQSGRIENDAWLQFAYSLTESNPDRDSVYWEAGPYQPFSVNNTYDYPVVYYLAKAGYNGNSGNPDEEQDAQEKAIAFFGKGIDYNNTIVELVSYEGESIKNKGSQIDMMGYSGGDEPVEMLAGRVMQIVARNPVTIDGSKFNGWVVRAALSFSTDEEQLRSEAFGGKEIPVDDDGYFNLYSNIDELYKDFESNSYGVNADLIAEMQKTSQEMQAEIQAGNYENIEYYSAKIDSLESLMDKNYSDGNVVIALAIFPKGFESMNAVEKKRELAYPALLQSGNAIQLNVKTDKFVLEEDVPFVKVVLTDLEDNVIDEGFFEYPNGGWPDMIQWEYYPLAPGMYLVQAEINNGVETETREWDFEVKAQIADGCAGCWYMVSFADVDLDNFKKTDDELIYWWNENLVAGKYWQYEEVSRVSQIELDRGYWYNSLKGTPLKLNGNSDAGNDARWVIDSVHSGWNMVASPYSWYVDVSELERDGLTFFRWDPEISDYRRPKYLKPYEAIWVRTSHEMEIPLPSAPAYVDEVDANGNTVPYLPLQKTHALAKASGSDDWSVQVSLSDAKGKMDSWNILGIASEGQSIEEPPEGMGDHVNLSIVEGGMRLAKSVKAKNASEAYEWNVNVSASTPRMAFLELAGINALRAYGLRTFVTIDGSTTEITEGSKIGVNVSPAAKTVNVRIAREARPVVAQTMQGLFARDMGGVLQVGFDVSEGLASARSRVDLVDMQGKVVRTETFNAQAGHNTVSLEKPQGGLYVVRAVAGSKVAVQKILIK